MNSWTPSKASKPSMRVVSFGLGVPVAGVYWLLVEVCGRRY